MAIIYPRTIGVLRVCKQKKQGFWGRWLKSYCCSVYEVLDLATLSTSKLRSVKTMSCSKHEVPSDPTQDSSSPFCGHTKYVYGLWMSIMEWLPRRKYIWPIPKLPDSDGFARWRPPDGPCNRKLEWPPHRSPLHDKTSPSFEMVAEPPFRPEQRYTYTWFRTYEDQSVCIIYQRSNSEDGK